MSEVNRGERTSAARTAERVRRAVGERAADTAGVRSTRPAWFFVGFSAICVFTMVGAGMVGSHDCQAGPIRLVAGLASDISAVVPANTTCTIVVKAGSMTLADIGIDTPPEHGSLTPRGRTGVVYRPQRGFKGEDRFEFSLRSGSDGSRKEFVIHVRAVVR